MQCFNCFRALRPNYVITDCSLIALWANIIALSSIAGSSGLSQFAGYVRMAIIANIIRGESGVWLRYSWWYLNCTHFETFEMFEMLQIFATPLICNDYALEGSNIISLIIIGRNVCAILVLSSRLTFWWSIQMTRLSPIPTYLSISVL